MSERKDPDEENAVGLTVHNENVNTENVNSAPSLPDEESFTEGNVQASGSITQHSFFSQSTPHNFFSQSVGSYVFLVPLRFFAPSSVTSLPPVSDGSWYPSPPLYSPFHPYRFTDASIGVTLRLQDPGSSFRPLSMMQSGISVRPETPSTPLGYSMAAVGQKKSTKKVPRLSTALERMSLGMLQPSGQRLRDTGETEESALLLTAAKAAAAESDEESPPAASILLQESSQEDAAVSRRLTRSTAVTLDLSLVDNGDRELYLSEGYAVGMEKDCLRDSEKAKLLGNCPLHCSNDINNSATAEDENSSAVAGASAVAEDDDGYDYKDDEERPPTSPILLRESFPRNTGISRSSATTVDLSSVQEDKGDLGSRGLFPPEGYAAATPRNWQRDSEELKLLNQSELHCSPSAGSLSSAQFDCASSKAFGSNLPNPSASAQQNAAAVKEAVPPDTGQSADNASAGSLSSAQFDSKALCSNLPNQSASAQENAAAVKEAAPPDTGQSAVDDEDLIIWRSCKICWDRRWRFVFIPCGHGSCKHCYVRLENTTCPFCRKCIRKIVEVRLCARLGQ